MVSQDGDHTAFFLVTYENGKRSRRGIGRNRQLVKELAHKAYLEELERRLKSNIALLEAACRKSLATDPQAVLQSMPRNFAIFSESTLLTGRSAQGRWPRPSRDPEVTPAAASLDTGDLSPEEWGALPYCENTGYLESKLHLSSRGVACRSKSEAAILEKYDSLGLPYHYDEVVAINGYRISPDVIWARADGKLIYHEHFGLNSEGYNSRRLWKLGLYECAGIREGDNLICTYDSSDGTLNMRLVEAQILDRCGA